MRGGRVEVVPDDQDRRGRGCRPWPQESVLPGAARPRPAGAPGQVPYPAETAVPGLGAVGGRLPGREGPRVDAVGTDDAGEASTTFGYGSCTAASSPSSVRITARRRPSSGGESCCSRSTRRGAKSGQMNGAYGTPTVTAIRSL